MKWPSILASKDGSLSLTKLAACTFHANLAGWVAWATHKDGFNIEIWLLYGSFAVGHATYDKTLAMVNAYKNKKLDKDASNPTT